MTKHKFNIDNKPKIRFAIVGAGISGLTATMLLSKKHKVTLYEANNYLGGHALTLSEKILVNNNFKNLCFDVGFLVYNNKNYPFFSKLLKILKVANIESNMSFSVSNKTNNFEYGSNGILSSTNNFKNIFKIKFWILIKEIKRFYKVSNNILDCDKSNCHKSVSTFLKIHKFNKVFINEHFLPMCGAIWSIPFDKVLKMPINTILVFFQNHGLLSFFGKPQWRTILGGSKNYVYALSKKINGNIYLNEKVISVRRKENSIIIKSKSFVKKFDKVIFATHPDDTLKLIENPSYLESKILSLCKYETNHILVHQDIKFMPKRKKSWSSWNVINNDILNNQNICVTYWINKLQNIKSDKPILVTLNADINDLPSSKNIIKKIVFRHPILNADYTEAKKQVDAIQGIKNIYFTGAWLGYGFHEDGVKSAIIIAKKYNAEL